MMKLFLFLFSFLLICSCKVPKNQYKTIIGFKEVTHDFGKIPFNRESSYSFSFSNTGNHQLIIYNVKTSCGCTVPEWNKNPVPVGKEGQIKIKYDTFFPGVFHKSVEVYYNGDDSPVKLEIRGEVESAQ